MPGALISALASALLGLMLCLSVSASARLTLRACLLMAGLEVVASLIGSTVLRFTPYQRFFDQFFEGNWQIVAIVLEAAILAMIDGLFTGAGLGLATGGWKSGWRFALMGMLAYGLGFAIGGIIQQLWIDSGWWIEATAHPVSLITIAIGRTVYSLWMWIGNSAYPVSVINICICGILAGGILGWFFEKVGQTEAGPVIRSGNV